MRAVRFHRHGDIDVLGVEDVALRAPGPREVIVKVRAAGINPVEAKIRTGALHEYFPAAFPSGEGSEYVVIPGGQLVAEPAALDWNVAGSLYVAGCSAHAAVSAVSPQPGEVVAVSAAAGGVGSIAVQLARLRGARVGDTRRTAGPPQCLGIPDPASSGSGGAIIGRSNRDRVEQGG